MTTKQPQLRGYRTEAETDIRRFVERWRELHGLVSGPMSDKAIEDLEEARARFGQLSTETAKMLMGIFVQDSVAGEFQRLTTPVTGENQPLLDARENLAVAATKRIDWLTKLQNDLDRFPESGRITVGGPR